MTRSRPLGSTPPLTTSAMRTALHSGTGTGTEAVMHILQVGFGFDEDLTSAEALLRRYATATGWSEALVGAGAERVTVLQRFHRDAWLARGGIDYIFYDDGAGGRPRPLAASRKLRAAIREIEPDVVHVNGLDFPLQTWRVRRMLPASTALVVQDHASGPPRDRGAAPIRLARRAVRRSAMRAADGFLFTAAEQAAAWREAGLIARRQRVYTVMEASTHVRPLPREQAHRVAAMEGNPAVLWVGRLNANKDPLTVLEGFERSLACLPEAALTMIYAEDDLLTDVTRRLRTSSALARRVRLVGRVPHARMPAFYSAADIFVSGSHDEGSGYALLEACACGVTPIVTSIPAFRAITGNGLVGALWTPGDAEGFRSALVDAARRDLRAARAGIVEHFNHTLSWDAVGRQAMAAYVDVVTIRRNGRPKGLHYD
jgi:glycosyltransferase involved in cell wall biosynthesis